MKVWGVFLSVLLLLSPAACVKPKPPAGKSIKRWKKSAAKPGSPAPNLVKSSPAPVSPPARSYTKRNRPTAKEMRFLLALARETVRLALTSRKRPVVDRECITPYLARPLACFVTLHTRQGKRLRGCMGMFVPHKPLYQNVISRALAAAFGDPRFPAVKLSELKELELEVSILTPPKPLANKSPGDLLQKLVPLRDGVLLRSRFGSSTYLPQVWKQLPDKRYFLSRLCLKHGAPARCWKQATTSIKTYRAIIFSEHEQKKRKSDWFNFDGPKLRCRMR